MATRRKGGVRKSTRKTSRKAGRKMGGGKMYGGKMYGGKPSRKAGRKGSRKMRGGKGCMMYGGAQAVLPASVNDSSMKAPSALSLAQGGDYEVLHRNQHGGFIAPVGHTGMLPADLQASARVLPTMQSLAAASGMQDGGARRRGKKINHRAIMAMLKKLNKKMKSRKQRGGMPYALTQAQDYSTPGMLLSPTAEKAALAGMNPEWKLASDPSAFAPKMA